MKYVAIDTSTTGANTLVSGVSGKKIVVCSYVMVADGTVTAQFKSDSTALTGAMALVVNSGVSVGVTPSGIEPDNGLFETAAGGALVLTLGGSVGVRGHLSYNFAPAT